MSFLEPIDYKGVFYYNIPDNYTVRRDFLAGAVFTEVLLLIFVLLFSLLILYKAILNIN
jgi:hypothetical protein